MSLWLSTWAQWTQGQFVSGASWLSLKSVMGGDRMIGGVPFPTVQGSLLGCPHWASPLTHQGVLRLLRWIEKKA